MIGIIAAEVFDAGRVLHAPIACPECAREFLIEFRATSNIAILVTAIAGEAIYLRTRRAHPVEERR